MAESSHRLLNHLLAFAGLFLLALAPAHAQTAQTISFPAISSVPYSTGSFALTATASSGLTVAFTSNSLTVCTVSSGTVTLVNGGTCSITASQAGNVSFTAAPSVTQTFAVTNTPQTLTLDRIPTQFLGSAPVVASTQSSAGLPVNLVTSTSSVCQAASTVITLLSAGTCIITANQSGNTYFTAATPVTVGFGVVRATASNSYSPATGNPFGTGSGPSAVAVGDLNKDGHPDFAVANSTDGTVTVWLNNGHGGFTAAAGNPFPAGSAPSSIVINDFNGDGFADIATANSGSNNVTVLLGNGLGAFTAATGSPFGAGTGPQAMAAGDFNADGIPDLAIANNGSKNVTILLGDGTGAFAAATGSPYTTGNAPQSIAVADFNLDGAPDLAIANNADGTVTVLLGGSNGFTQGGLFTVGTSPHSVVVGDFNGDGFPDFAVDPAPGNTVTVFLGNGSGGFTAVPVTSSAAGSGTASIVAGDFNGDGVTDLAVANQGSGNIALLLGGGIGTFTSVTTPLTAGASPSAIAAADFNSDGVLDLVIANSGGGSASVLLGSSATAQTINFLPALPLSSPQVGIPPSSLFATATSGLPVTFVSSTTSVCTVSGSLLTVIATGTCAVTALQAGNGVYAAAAVTQLYAIQSASGPPSGGPPAAGRLSLTITRNSEIALGSSVSTAVTAAGGVPPYSWYGTGLPQGITVNTQTGVLNGFPTAAGNYTFTVYASDSEATPESGTVSVTLQVLGFTTATTLPTASTSTAYATTFTAAGGSGTYSYSIANPPAGLALNGGVLSGTPTAVGSFSFAVQVSDGTGVAASSIFTLSVTGPATPLKVSGGALTSGVTGSAYLQALTATGGTPPYTWTITGGALPPGLTLGSSTGLISGTPSAVRSVTFTAQAVDSTNTKASGIFTLAVTSQSLTLTGLPFAAGIVGTSYPAQVLTGSGGTAPYTFALASGSLPPGLTLANGQIAGTPITAGSYNFSVTMGDSESPAQTVTIPSQVVVAASGSATLFTSSGSISFQLNVGATSLPAPAVVTVESSAAQQQSVYSTSVTPAATWLDVSLGGTTPGVVTVALDPTALGLAASSTPLTTSLVITCFGGSICAGQTITIPVTLTVSSAAPQLSFNQNYVSFTTSAGSTSALSATVPLANIGGGSASITSIATADSWLTIPNPPTTISAGAPVNLTFTANPSSLSAGYHTTTVTVQSSAGSLTLPVTIEVAPSAVLTLGTSGAHFQSTVGDAPANTGGSVQIGALGTGTVSWTATVLPGAPWLTIGGSASGAATFTSPATLNYSVSASALTAAGAYYGTIQITAPGVTNSPLNFEVLLTVAPSSAPAVPVLQPSGLVFTYVLGSGIAPDSQQINVNSTSGIATPFAASVSSNAAAWLSIDTNTGLSSANPTQFYSTVSVTPGGLAAGTYTGSVSYQFSAAAIQSLNVTLIVEKAPAPPFGCTPSKLVPTFTGLAGNFSLNTGWPAPISVTVTDDCGNTIQNATVVATFSNNDPPVALSLPASGVYTGTWTPANTSEQATVTVTATSPSALISAGTATVTGTVLPGPAPQLTPGGTLHLYNEQVGSAIPPGTILEIYGANLSAAPVLASTIPLPNTLGGTSVTIGGYPAPLYYVSASQIDAELPTELTPGNSYQVVVTSNGAPSMPQTVQIAAAVPGIATQASGLAIAQDQSTGAAITESSPAKPGENLTIYVIGLGATSNPVADGNAAVANPLSIVTATPTVTLNGENVTPSFAGLAPGYVALYQINFTLPGDAVNGDAALVISQNGVVSNAAVLPVHN